MDNPFVIDGEIADNDRFIGRREIIESIEDLIFRDNPVNMALIGVNGIGTSSLVHTAILNQKNRLIDDKKVIPIWIRSISYEQSSSFFTSLVDECNTEMKNLGYSLEKDLVNNALEALKPSDPWVPWNAVRNFFRALQETGCHMLIILDRFDVTRHILKENVNAFEFLRELASEPYYAVSLILTSRMTTAKIQQKANTTLSLLPGIFTNGTYHLGMFSEEDLKTYFDRFSHIISKEAKERVLYYCGRHPFLLNILGWQIVNDYQNQAKEVQKDDVDKIAQSILSSIGEYYKSLIELLNELGTFDKLLQILFSDSKPHVDDGLESYGLIKPDPTTEGAYVAYSEHFQEYLRENQEDLRKRLMTVKDPPTKPQELSKEIEFSSETSDFSDQADELRNLWTRAERALRKVITTTMHNWNQDWINQLEKLPKFTGVRGQNRDFKTIFKNARQTLSNKKSRNQKTLIDFVQPQDLFDIILHEDLWQLFENIFTRDSLSQEDWKTFGRFISERRPEPFHSQGDLLTDDEKAIFMAFCNHILTLVSDWKNSTPPETGKYAEAKQVKTEEDSSTPGKYQNQDNQEALHQDADEPEAHEGIVIEVNKGSLSYCFIQPTKPEGSETESIRAHKDNFRHDKDFELLNKNDQVVFTRQNNSVTVLKRKCKG